MLVDDIGDVTITNDGATILKRLEIQHPAAKVRLLSLHNSPLPFVLPNAPTFLKLFDPICSLFPQILVELADLQDSEVGDGTTSVVIIASELLRKGSELVRQKIHPTSIIGGFRMAMREAVKYIEETLSLPVDKLGKVRFFLDFFRQI